MSTFGEISSTEPMENYFLPPGVIMPYGGTSTTAPDGWLFCNGFSHSRTTYSDLYAVVGDAYGAGNGSTTFNVPDLRRKFPLGFSDASNTGTAVAQTGGTFDHTHNTTNHTHTMGSHTHSMQNHSHGMEHTHGVTIPGFNINTTTFTTPAPWGETVYTNYNARRDGLEDVGAVGAPQYFNLIKITGFHAAFNHYHPIDIPNMNGSTGASTSSSTGPPSAANTGAPSDNTTGSAGSAQTSSNNPPYITLQYIIKI
jgi:microcystin-dependent protein